MPDEPVQRGEDGVEARPVRSFRLPALQHQGVKGRGAAVGGREPVLIRYRLHHLQTRRGRRSAEVGQTVEQLCAAGSQKRSLITERL